MRFSGRLACLAIGILGVSVVTAPLIKVVVDWLLHTSPRIAALVHFDAAEASYDFGRIYRRFLLVLTILLGYFGRRWLGPLSLRGIGSPTRPGRQLASGWLLGSCSFGLFLAILIIAGERSLAPTAPRDWSWRLGGALVSGLVVGIIEEAIFRGFLLGGLLHDWSRLAAVLGSSGVFSAVHFLRAKVPVTPGFTLDVGLQALVGHLRPFTHPAILFPFLGLFLLGVILAYAYLWSDSLPFVIGLHAGWVFLGKIDGLLLRERTGIEWLYGQGGVLAGPLGWTLLLLMLPLLRLWISWTSKSDHR